MTITAAQEECKKRTLVGTAGVNGHEYDLTGPEREVIVADFHNLDTEDVEKKWARVRRSPTRGDLTTSESEVQALEAPKRG